MLGYVGQLLLAVPTHCTREGGSILLLMLAQLWGLGLGLRVRVPHIKSDIGSHYVVVGRLVNSYWYKLETHRHNLACILDYLQFCLIFLSRLLSFTTSMRQRDWDRKMCSFIKLRKLL